MYVDTSQSKQKGKTYFRYLLRESYREQGKVKHRTIANLSHCSKQEIEAIKLALKHKDKLAVLTTIKDINTTQGMRIGALWALKVLADRIGLSKILGYDRQGKLALWQVCARLMSQGSRLSAVRLAQSHAACDILGLDTFHEDHLYQNLAWLSDNQETIEKRLFQKQYGKTPPDLFLYDVTSSYLEGVKNILGAYGYNRDKKRGKQQVVIGLLTGPDGTPIAVRVFEGNTADTRTVAEQIRTVTKIFGVNNVTFVGDRGMLKTPQIELLQKHDFHYITAITKAQIRTLLSEGVLQMDLFDEEICTVEEDKISYILRRNPERSLQVAASREDKYASLCRYVDKKNRYLAEHSRAQVETVLRDIEKRVHQLRIHRWVKPTMNDREVELQVDATAKERAMLLDGCYVLKTDLPSNHVSSADIHERYKDLSKVEYAFRTFKTGHLETRPFYVRSEASTRGHVFVVMLAYRLERELYRYWRRLNVTVEEGIEELGSLRGIELKVKKTICQSVPSPTGTMKQLLNAAEITLPEILPRRKVHVATRKNLVSERKNT